MILVRFALMLPAFTDRTLDVIKRCRGLKICQGCAGGAIALIKIYLRMSGRLRCNSTNPDFRVVASGMAAKTRRFRTSIPQRYLHQRDSGCQVNVPSAADVRQCSESRKGWRTLTELVGLRNPIVEDRNRLDQKEPSPIPGLLSL